jgi:stage V sporulation protein S
MVLLRVAASSRTSSLAGAIAGVIRENKYVELQAIGAAAINQAVKALVVATLYLKEEGIKIAFKPEFVDVGIEDRIVTGIKFVVAPKELGSDQSEGAEPGGHEPPH